MNRHYNTLLKQGRDAATLGGVLSLLHWDQETYMPSMAVSARSGQMALLAKLHHKAKTSAGFKNALAKLIDLGSGQILANDLTKREEAALKLWRRDYLRAVKLPASFVQRFEKLLCEATQAWALSRKEDAFPRFQPYLERIFAMAREKAERIGSEGHLYDALLDEYEPGATYAKIAPLFRNLRDFLQPFLKKMGQSPQVDDSCLHGNFAKEPVIAFCHQLLAKMGYDLNKGRLDYSTHPFSSAAHPTDSRITTRFDPEFLKSTISTVLHEGGHG